VIEDGGFVEDAAGASEFYEVVGEESGYCFRAAPDGRVEELLFEVKELLFKAFEMIFDSHLRSVQLLHSDYFMGLLCGCENCESRRWSDRGDILVGVDFSHEKSL
jgi:hypothetical protein